MDPNKIFLESIPKIQSWSAIVGIDPITLFYIGYRIAMITHPIEILPSIEKIDILKGLWDDDDSIINLSSIVQFVSDLTREFIFEENREIKNLNNLKDIIIKMKETINSFKKIYKNIKKI